MGYTRQPTLTASKNPVMVEFDHVRNQEAGLDPDKITLGSGKKVHWVAATVPEVSHICTWHLQIAAFAVKLVAHTVAV